MLGLSSLFSFVPHRPNCRYKLISKRPYFARAKKKKIDFRIFLDIQLCDIEFSSSPCSMKIKYHPSILMDQTSMKFVLDSFALEKTFFFLYLVLSKFNVIT